MKRRAFIRGSAIIGASIAIPTFLTAGSGMGEEKGRKVHRILSAQRTKVGDLPVLRLFAGDNTDYVSPFVFFDEFGPIAVNPREMPLSVGAHPHAGIIPTSYFLSGNGHHTDSLNHDFQVAQGDFMMFTAGRGALHREETGQMMYDNGGIYHGFQIWLNLPSRYKFIDPGTHVFRTGQMDEINHKDYHAKVVLGELFGAKSKIETLFPVFYYHIKLNAGSKLSIPTDPRHNAFIYVIKGNLEAEGRKAVAVNEVALYERGESLINIFSAEASEVLVLGGMPHHEPVLAYGPFVMNTEDEIRRCIEDYNAGKMGDPDILNATGLGRG